MSVQHSSYWQGKPLSQLSRDSLELAAGEAIGKLMEIAERERERQGFDMASIAFAAGGLLAGLGALTGILLAH